MSKVITKKRGKSWQYEFEIEPKADGKRQRRTKSGFRTQAEANKAGNLAYTEYLNNKIIGFNKEILFKDFILEWWDLQIEPYLKLNTKATYTTQLNSRILPYFGNYKLKAISKIEINKYLVNCAKDSTKNVLNRQFTILKRIFTAAHEDFNYISTNPIVGVKIPINCVKTNKGQRTPLDKEQLEVFKRFLPKEIYFFVNLLINTGMRRGEALGLLWQDIDLENKVIHVRHNLVHRKEITMYIDSPKTKTSVRDIYITEDFKNTLLEKRESTKHFYFSGKEENGLTVLGPADNGVEFVATSFNGLPLSYNVIQRYLNTLGTNCHSIRHTYTTMLLEAGANVKAVQEQLGHANANVTLSVYAHNTEKLRNEAVEILGNCLRTKKA